MKPKNENNFCTFIKGQNAVHRPNVLIKFKEKRNIERIVEIYSFNKTNKLLLTTFKKSFIIMCCLLAASHCLSQKHDYNFINRSFSNGSAISIHFHDSIQNITIDHFEWEGTVSYSPTLSDRSGRFLGYFNSRNVYDSIGRVAINGDSMAVGYFLNYFFQFLPEHEGLGNGGNSAFIPINDSLFYLFYKSAELWIGAPGFAIHFEENGQRLNSYSDGLFLSKIRLNPQNRLYILPEEKHILLVDDLFQHDNLISCKHANGLDWWLIVPKALNSEACRLLIHTNGEIEKLGNIEFSDNFWRVRSMVSCKLSPDGSKLARLIVRSDTLFEHLLQVFHFNRCDGIPERFIIDSIPLSDRYTSGGDIEFSANGRYLFTAIGNIILQMDLDDPNFFSTPDTIAKWDGFLYYDLFAPLFDCFWRLPNGKILVSSRVATPFLHYIHEPNRPGDQCMFEQRAIMLPVDPLNEPFGVFITALPNFPPFRMPPLDTLCITSTTDIFDSKIINVYPNPVIDIFSITCTAVIHDITVFDLNGIPVMSSMVSGNQDHYEFSLEDWPSGIYFVVCRDSNKKIVGTKKLVKI